MLLVSDDGFRFSPIGSFQDEYGDETAMLFEENGDMFAVSRRRGGRTAQVVRLKAPYTSSSRVGLDRSEAALGSAGSRAGEQPGLGWVQGELFEGSFARDLEPGVLFTVHLHELAAQGDLAGELARLRPQLAGWRLVAFEQPLPEEAPADRRQAEWLYAWSNVLIHHLIGNGCIHSDAGWRDLLARAGLELESAEPLGYLGYRAYVARF
jgi:hypothetical protein